MQRRSRATKGLTSARATSAARNWGQVEAPDMDGKILRSGESRGVAVYSLSVSAQLAAYRMEGEAR